MPLGIISAYSLQFHKCEQPTEYVYYLRPLFFNYFYQEPSSFYMVHVANSWCAAHLSNAT